MKNKLNSSNFIKSLIFFSLILPMPLLGSFDSWLHGLVHGAADAVGSGVSINPQVIKTKLINYVKANPTEALENFYNCPVTKSVLASCGIPGSSDWSACAENTVLKNLTSGGDIVNNFENIAKYVFLNPSCKAIIQAAGFNI